MTRWPDIVIVGAQKAGSTFLADALHASGLIWMQRDEVPFFEAPFFENSDHRQLELALASAPPGMRTGIKRPDYLARPEVPMNLAGVPDVRLAAVLRDPVDRAIAAVAWYVLHGLLPARPLGDLLRSLLDDHAAGRLSGRPSDIIEFGRYGEAAERYLTYFPPERFHLIDNDDLRTEAGLQSAIAQILEIDPGRVPVPIHGRRGNVGVYHPLRLRLLRLRVPLVFDWSKADSYVYRPRRRYRPVRTLIAGVPLAADRLILRQLVDDCRPQVDPVIRHDLATIYESDSLKLESLTGYDTAHWRRKWDS